MNSALIVFAKVPLAGHVKTRLTPDLGDDEAAQLYEAFLLDALDVYRRLDHDVRLYVAPGAGDLNASLVPPGVAVFRQRGMGLGDRMGRAFLETFAAGYERVGIVGTDHPTLPPTFIQLAFDALSKPRSVAIGPAEDGGYYLLAMNDFVAQIFREMSYSHSGVFAATLERIAASGADAIVLPEWYDVDTPDQLRRLRADLAAADGLAPRTKRQVERLANRYPWLAG